MHKPKKNQPKRKLEWYEFYDLVKQLSLLIPDNKYICGIPRNGSVIAVLISHLRPNLKYQHSLFGAVQNYGDKDVIVIDDIHDSGNTLNNYPYSGLPSATLFWRKKEETNKPTYFVETVEDDTYIIFPWEI
jgi:hypothetical protein